MLSHEEWLHSDHTVNLLRWLEKKREEHQTACVDYAAHGSTPQAAHYAGKVFVAKETLAKIREKKNESL